jgi:hypothetical protein
MKNNNKCVVYHCEEKITGIPHNDRKIQSNITNQPMNPKANNLKGLKVTPKSSKDRALQ